MFLKHKPTLKSVIYPSGQPQCDLQKFQDVHCHLCTTEVNRTQSSKTFHMKLKPLGLFPEIRTVTVTTVTKRYFY